VGERKRRYGERKSKEMKREDWEEKGI